MVYPFLCPVVGFVGYPFLCPVVGFVGYPFVCLVVGFVGYSLLSMVLFATNPLVAEIAALALVTLVGLPVLWGLGKRR